MEGSKHNFEVGDEIVLFNIIEVGDKNLKSLNDTRHEILKVFLF